MYEIHPEIVNFAQYCKEHGFEVSALAQEYADQNPLSYGNYLMAHFCATDVVDYAGQMGWDISKRPDIVIEIASEIKRSTDPEYGIGWETIRERIRKAFNDAPPEIQALAEGSKLKNPYTGEDEEMEAEDEEHEQHPPSRYGDYAN